MTQPVTELDTQFSDQDAVATDWNETRRALEQAELFWISTVRADGRPHVTPLVAVSLDDAIHFATGPDERRAVNLRTNQNVILTTGCNQWERGFDVVVEGEAVQVRDESVLERLAETWATKWDGRWHYEVHDGSFRHEGESGLVLVFSVEADQGARLRQGHLRPDPTSVLSAYAPNWTCRCGMTVYRSLATDAVTSSRLHLQRKYRLTSTGGLIVELSAGSATPTEEEIRFRAYYLYVERMRDWQEGTATDDWLLAEAELADQRERSNIPSATSALGGWQCRRGHCAPAGD